MKYTQIFPTIMMTLSILSSMMYFIDGDWRKGVYWVAGATLTFTVTF